MAGRRRGGALAGAMDLMTATILENQNEQRARRQRAEEYYYKLQLAEQLKQAEREWQASHPTPVYTNSQAAAMGAIPGNAKLVPDPRAITEDMPQEVITSGDALRRGHVTKGTRIINDPNGLYSMPPEDDSAGDVRAQYNALRAQGVPAAEAKRRLGL